MSLHPPPRFKYPSEIRIAKRGVRAKGSKHTTIFVTNFWVVAVSVLGIMASPVVLPSLDGEFSLLSSGAICVELEDVRQCRIDCMARSSR